MLKYNYMYYTVLSSTCTYCHCYILFGVLLYCVNVEPAVVLLVLLPLICMHVCTACILNYSYWCYYLRILPDTYLN